MCSGVEVLESIVRSVPSIKIVNMERKCRVFFFLFFFVSEEWCANMPVH